MDARDTWNFRVGQPIHCVWSSAGGVRLAPRWERITGHIEAKWVRLTRWWRPRSVVSAIDAERGEIVLVTERWSWRRWRWELA